MANTQPFEFTESEWRRIAQCATLPAQSRPAVENFVSLYRAFESIGAQPTHRNRAQLKALSGQALALHKKLLKLVQDPEIHFALTVPPAPKSGWPRAQTAPTRLEGHQRLVHSLESVERLANWLSQARGRLKPMKSGASRRAANLLWLVGHLETILFDHTKRRISRSGKRTDPSREYVTVICQIADPTIGTGAIEYAMQKNISSRKTSR